MILWRVSRILLGGRRFHWLVSRAQRRRAPTGRLSGRASSARPCSQLAILGLYISRMTVAASEVTEREKVILIADALVDSVTASGRRYLFRPAPKASQHGETAVKFVQDEAATTGIEMKKVAILNEDSSFGRSNATGAMNEALNEGLHDRLSEGVSLRSDRCLVVGERYRQLGSRLRGALPVFHRRDPLAKTFPRPARSLSSWLGWEHLVTPILSRSKRSVRLPNTTRTPIATTPPSLRIRTRSSSLPSRKLPATSRRKRLG